LPQWNCACGNCRAARAGAIPCRTQSSVALSADGERWLIVNASPDIRQQAQCFAPSSGRGSKIAAVALTSADVDHTSGLFVLREGGAPPIYATPPVLRALDVGLGVVRVLSAFGSVRSRPFWPGKDCFFSDGDGNLLGIAARVIPLPGRPPPYMRLGGEPSDPARGDTIGLAFWATGGADATRGAGTVLYAPGIAAVSDELESEATRASVILVDGTCFSNEETQALVGRTSADMGHLPIGGEGGTLAWLKKHPGARRIYVHINNTNPVLDPASPERREVEAAGVEVGRDGVEFIGLPSSRAV
jgi:pyrroloquinoline quinone biosynthesis protein B